MCAFRREERLRLLALAIQFDHQPRSVEHGRFPEGLDLRGIHSSEQGSNQTYGRVLF